MSNLFVERAGASRICSTSRLAAWSGTRHTTFFWLSGRDLPRKKINTAFNLYFCYVILHEQHCCMHFNCSMKIIQWNAGEADCCFLQLDWDVLAAWCIKTLPRSLNKQVSWFILLYEPSVWISSEKVVWILTVKTTSFRTYRLLTYNHWNWKTNLAGQIWWVCRGVEKYRMGLTKWICKHVYSFLLG